MQIQPGSHLGNYEIVGPLGAGGMGEVYRAHDPKLERDVAIKVLPEDFAQNSERLARFEREARALAALNHPNIATVHGFEQDTSQDSSEDGDRHFLVMELVEGEDLAERIRRGPIPVDEAIPLFLQIADGLETAHERGIVHRDLKPANIKVTDEGRVKILDFGLAKALEPHGETDPDLSQSPTMTLAATMRGEILGTAAYMSPEQARGKPVDKRTDNWAFGACLFEALTGRRAFAGDDVSVSLARVIEGEPIWDALPARTPASLHRLLRRCLVKDPRRRLRDIGDARLELEGVGDDAERSSREPAEARDLPRAAVLLIAAAFGALVMAALLWNRASSESDTTVRHLRLALPPGVELRTGLKQPVSLSPDGHHIAFLGQRDGQVLAFLDDLTDQAPATEVRSSRNASSLFFSPDGRRLGFVQDEIVTVPLSGGTPERRISVAPYAHGGAVMDRDGAIWFVENYLSGVRRLAPDDTVTEIHEPAPGRIVYETPRPLPGGRFVLASTYRDGGLDTVAIDVETGEETVLLTKAFAPQYLESGHLVAAQDGALVAMPFDPSTLEVGSPTTVLRGVSTVWTGASAGYWVSESGDLLYLSGDPFSERWLVRLVPGEAPVRLHDEPISASEVALSTDGELVVGSWDQDLYLFDLEQGSLQERLTFTDDSDWNVSWSPDSRTLAYSAIRDGQWVIAVRQVGSAEERILVRGDAPAWPSTWLPDGSAVVFNATRSDTQSDLWLAPLGSSGEARAILRTPAQEGNAQFSPDGGRLAFISTETGPRRISIVTFPDLGARTSVPGSEGADLLRWLGDRLFFERSGKVWMSEVSQRGDEVEVTLPSVFVDGIDSLSAARAWDVMPDGRSVIAIEPPSEVELRLVQNWIEELKELVPVE